MCHRVDRVFLSTLSLRRATESIENSHNSGEISIHALLTESDNINSSVNTADKDFYPRSPYGERPRGASRAVQRWYISIHALLTESDEFGKLRNPSRPGISIHALLTESDAPSITPAARRRNFYPRSPYGERRAPQPPQNESSIFLSTLSLRRATLGAGKSRNVCRISIHALLTESDLFKNHLFFIHNLFLSTLSLRRATAERCEQ